MTECTGEGVLPQRADSAALTGLRRIAALLAVYGHCCKGCAPYAVTSAYFGDDWLFPTAANWLSVHVWYPIRFKGELAAGIGYSINWSISTEIGMYVMFAFALAIAGRFQRMRTIIAAGAASYFMAILAVYFVGGIGPSLAALPVVYEALDPNAAWRWFTTFLPISASPSSFSARAPRF